MNIIFGFDIFAFGFVVGYLIGSRRRPSPLPANGAPQVVVLTVGPVIEQR